MQAFKCKICGGDVIVDRASRIAVCEYCGTKQVLPQFSDDSSKRLYESGHHYLQNGEYDKAEVMFNQLLAINPQDAEICWDLVLCKYGVTFVKDPKTEKYIPTCNRTHYDCILNDKNYQNTLKYSDAGQMEFYRKNAETINNIQKGILTVSKKEKPFDVFISHKETDREGNRTKDSIAAQNLYEKLTENGYKVFFSRITLEDKIGTEYEPYIYAALYSSKIMLTICSSKENIESPWVRNEWSRFLMLRQNNTGKTLIPLYFDMPKSDLPDEFALLSSYDMEVDGFEQELLHGIKKLIPLPIMKAARRKRARKVAGIVAAVVCATAAIVAAVVLPNYFKVQRLQEQYTTAVAMFQNADYEGASVAFLE
ncbi:MAG: toll/interleukin-1 receptor domain-containing protein, partial [Christensenellaceae bacterium]